MNKEMDGKQIKGIWLNGDKSVMADSKKGLTLELSATYHGDRDEFWVIGKQHGKEIQRYNCRYVATIHWLETE